MKSTGQLINYVKQCEMPDGLNQGRCVPISCVMNFGNPGANGLSKLQELAIGHRRSSTTEGPPSFKPPASDPDTYTGFDLSPGELNVTGYTEEEKDLLIAIIHAATKARASVPNETSLNALRDKTMAILARRDM